MADLVLKSNVSDHMTAVVTSTEYTATTATAVLSAMTSRGLRRIIYISTTTATLYINRSTTAVTSTSGCLALAGGSTTEDTVYMGKIAYFTASTNCHIVVEETKYSTV